MTMTKQELCGFRLYAESDPCRYVKSKGGPYCPMHLNIVETVQALYPKKNVLKMYQPQPIEELETIHNPLRAIPALIVGSTIIILAFKYIGIPVFNAVVKWIVNG